MNFRREDPIYVYETLSKVIDPLGRTRRVSFGLMRHQPREWDTGPAQNVRNEFARILTLGHADALGNPTTVVNTR